MNPRRIVASDNIVLQILYIFDQVVFKSFGSLPSAEKNLSSINLIWICNKQLHKFLSNKDNLKSFKFSLPIRFFKNSVVLIKLNAGKIMSSDGHLAKNEANQHHYGQMLREPRQDGRV